MKLVEVWVDIITECANKRTTLTYLLLGLALLCLIGTFLLLAFALLEQSLRYQDLVLGGDAPISRGMSVDPLAQR